MYGRSAGARRRVKRRQQLGDVDGGGLGQVAEVHGGIEPSSRREKQAAMLRGLPQARLGAMMGSRRLSTGSSECERRGVSGLSVGRAGRLLSESVFRPRNGRFAAGRAGDCGGVRQHTVGWGSVPLAALAPVSAALGSDGRGYRMHARRWSSRGEPHRSAGCRPRGARIRSGGAVVGLRLTAIGYGRSLPRGHRRAIGCGESLTYPDAGVSEWYSNRPLGIEQGFTIPDPRRRRMAEPSADAVARALGQLRASLQHGGQQLVLNRGGSPALAIGT